MPQILVRPTDIVGKEFVIRGKEAHHVIHVLRHRLMDEVEIFDGAGNRFKARLTKIEDAENLVQGKILNALRAPSKLFKTRLIQGLPKGSKFDTVLEKATELGVDEIIPFLSKKNLIKLNASQAQSKAGRWEKVVEAAAKQSNRSALPRLEKVMDFKALEPWLREGCSVILHPSKNNASFRDVLTSKWDKGRILNLIIGPDSGFTDQEVDWAKTRGVYCVSLGELILRTETAGPAALSIVNYEKEGM